MIKIIDIIIKRKTNKNKLVISTKTIRLEFFSYLNKLF